MKAAKFPMVAMILVIGQIFYGCQSEDFTGQDAVLELPSIPYNYQMGAKDELPTLGRVLFYDPRLSVNNSVSCASCHKQNMAFTDGKKFSLGFENKRTDRNSMPIQNIISNISFGKMDSIKAGNGVGIPEPGVVIIKPSEGNPGDKPGFLPGNNTDPNRFALNATALFWDGRQRSLHTMVMEPIKNHIEMGTADLGLLADKLSGIKEYNALFTQAFDDGRINPENIAKALSAFLVSIRSNQSKFDRSQSGNQEELSGLEQTGRHLFFNTYNCNSCHQLQAPFNGYQLAGAGEFGGFTDIGLDKNPSDGGVFRVTGNESDKGKFKIPSLRNIALTGPYMHDGRFETLEDVLDHYSKGINNSQNLDARLQQSGEARKFNIPLVDKKAIVAFLHSMTDYTMISDPKFSNPFKLN